MTAGGLMRAVVMRAGGLVVDEVPEPVPGPGQVLVETLACGICGSDLSALAHTEEFLRASRDSGSSAFVFDPDADVVLGHEFCARVVRPDPENGACAAGQIVVALPWALDGSGTLRTVGYSNAFPGGYGERMVLQSAALVPVPGHVPPRLAALTEPLAVGFGNVARSAIGPGGSAVVIGCGPVGLGAVAGLAERAVAPVVVSDPSAKRREAAVRLGAHRAVDPRREDPVEVWRTLAGAGQQLTVFNCAAVPGLLNELLYAVPRRTKIMQIGALMTDDTFRPVVGIYKDVVIEMCMVYPPEEYPRTLRRIAEGSVEADALITGEVGQDGLAAAVEALRDPGEHIKILVRPGAEAPGAEAPGGAPT
ncbi:zinc-binding dehydrogenase [Streptomyces iconiensis]|uniref:Zinc-binding dehydrogenase n=1 Tax=Streptomyces iconiensis TaxID=1384038 RepID=A0ABT7A3J5_9ACTN|nr:zinc-binding dehydrogenase [Streptomyces iconiensis]MDJ1135884.1 zinc-binding dehydrogenase [Streptomyces iconiensis]